MHEISIANGILSRAVDAANEHGADRIDALTIEIGRATHVNPEQVVFCLEAIADSTPAAEATIRTETIQPRAECDCGWEGTPESLDLPGGFAPNIRCPDCGQRADLVRGRECRLASIEVPDASPEDKPPARRADEVRGSPS
ncbi:hydrogenase maturation nickel metallochaperone HypA/HybF [Halodesulfurarchaeum formicicum]|uniref:Hydrogenase maturation factor HypA n=1 Tax=Halodesulfurarchaeum formicicum TaxID=1873524 RepID=A0A1J1ABG1_9EURY|nr:hydrogenase/urease maturation nickel metallochaperone HypA [Halodesulfurarchaeum formicicum]APE95136.1 hydrogenase nickel incorporation protein HypA/HybF [Halodesulfurarchaeum formicicum]